jgi:antitoxin component of MazEF toxin-antitoxin module
MEDKIIKKIIRVGNGTGVLIDAKMLYKSDLRIGDQLEVKCSKNKIILTKKEK